MPVRAPLGLVASLLLLTAALPASLAGQTEIRARAATIQIGGRLHTQYANSSVPDAIDDLFFRRARITTDIVINDFVDGKVEVDFAGGAALQDTYFRLTFSPALRVAGGIFKRAFSAWDVLSSTDWPTIERDAAIEGLDVCPGVGGICSFSGLTQRLLLDGRDMGMRAEGTAGRLVYQVTVSNGTGNNKVDENDEKSVSGRLGFRVADGVVLTGFGALHDYVTKSKETEFAPAYGADLEIGTFREGLHVVAGVATGENWKLTPRPDFLTAQLFTSWYQALESSKLAGLEPHLRLGWGDGNRDAEADAGVLLTPGFLIYFSGKNALGTDLDLYNPQSGDTEWSFKVQTFLYF